MGAALTGEQLVKLATPNAIINANNPNVGSLEGGAGPLTVDNPTQGLKQWANKNNIQTGSSGTSVNYRNTPAPKKVEISGVGSSNNFVDPVLERQTQQTTSRRLAEEAAKKAAEQAATKPTVNLPPSSSPATKPSTINQAIKNLPSLPTDLDSGLTKSGPIWQPARSAAGEATEAAAKGAAKITGDALRGTALGVGRGVAQALPGAILKAGTGVIGIIGDIISNQEPGNVFSREEQEFHRLANKEGTTTGLSPTQSRLSPDRLKQLRKEAQRNIKIDDILTNPDGIDLINDTLKNRDSKPVEPKAPTKDNLQAPKIPSEKERNLDWMRKVKELEKNRSKDPEDNTIEIPLLTPDGKPFDPFNPPQPKTPRSPNPYNPSNPPTPETPRGPRPIAPPAPFDPTPTPNPPLTTPNDPFKPIAPPVPKDDKKLTPTPVTPPKPKIPPVDKPGFGGVNLNFPISENLLAMKFDLSQIGEKQVQPRLDVLQKKLNDDYQIKLDDQTGKLTKEIEKSTDKILKGQKDQTSLIVTALTGLPALIGTALAPKFAEIISTLTPKFTDLGKSINENINLLPDKIINPVNENTNKVGAELTNNINQLPNKIINPVNKNTNMVGANLMNNATSQSQLIQQQLHDTQANNLTALTTMTGQCNPACGSGSGGSKKPNDKEAIKKVKFPNPTKDYNRPNPRNKWAVTAKPDMEELELKTDLDKMNYLIDAVNRLDQLFPIKEIVGGKFDKDLMAPTGLTGDRNIPIYNYFQLTEYMFRAWDKRIGAPAPIKIKDSDPLTPGSQPITVKPANLFEANNLIYKTSFDASRDIDLTNALATRTMLMTANCYKVVAQMYGYLEAILSDLGMETTEELLKLNLPCDPYAGKGEFAGDGKGFEFKVDGKFDSNKEQDIEDLAGAMLKPSQVPVKYIKKSDVTTLRHIVEGVGRFAAATAAAHALPLNDIDKILKHRVKQEQLETALQIRRGQLANGIGPIEKKQDK